MKKILVLVMVLVATSASTFAINPKDYAVFYSLNNKSTFTGLINYLGADKEQADYLKQVFNATSEELENAAKTGNDKLADSALKYNLYNAKCVLSEKQYKKYLSTLNLSIYNESQKFIAQN
jgi:hypothetical protein